MNPERVLMGSEERIPEVQYRLLETLAQGRGDSDVEELAAAMETDQAQIAAAAVLLERRAWVTIRVEKSREWTLTAAGRECVEQGWPERRVLRALQESGGSSSMKELPAVSGLDSKMVGGTLRILRERRWVEQEGPVLSLSPAGREALSNETDEETFLAWLSHQEGARADDAALAKAAVSLSEDALNELARKRKFLDVKTRARRFPALSDEGRGALEIVKPLVEISQLTPEVLASGAWKQARFKAYDVGLDVEPVVAGKTHPLQRVVQEARKAFLQMGFTEIASPFVESSFWDFDALFQPQDHPAREMQDTFYMENPGRVELPEDGKMVDRVRAVHEDGGDTGSRGWQIPWDPELARGAVLRTHCTAATARGLARNPAGPHRVFCIGQVFRREAITFKHLPVFIQVDGIIIDERGSFASLLGTLGQFYKGMGFPHYEFRPAFFPYTEPSVEVYIYYEPKKTWVEMGGAGVFRPEVTRPLGCDVPVLAWGLGLERLAMLRYQVLHMRDLYLPDIQWLKDAPTCPS